MLSRPLRLLVIAVCLSATTAPPERARTESPVFCGGETDVAIVRRWFSDLRDALAKPGPSRRFNKFVASRFSVRNSHGRSVYFDVSDVGSVTPRYITVRDWKEISRRGFSSLKSAGWRGCFMGAGKAWFEGSRGDGFRLAGIARDMPWGQPEKGDDPLP